jgi:hypothetical protein
MSGYRYTLICYRGYKKHIEYTDYLITAIFKFLRLKESYKQINIEYKKCPYHFL